MVAPLNSTSLATMPELAAHMRPEPSILQAIRAARKTLNEAPVPEPKPYRFFIPRVIMERAPCSAYHEEMPGSIYHCGQCNAVLVERDDRYKCPRCDG